MRVGLWAAAAAAVMCAGQASAVTFTRYQVSGSGTLQTFDQYLRPLAPITNQLFTSTFEIYTSSGIYVDGNDEFFGDGNTSSFTGSNEYNPTGRSDGSISGKLTYQESDPNPNGGTGGNVSVSYADTDQIGGFPTSVASNIASGTENYSSQGLFFSQTYMFTGTISSFRVIGSSGTFSPITLTLLPEPSTWLTMIFGLALLGAALRRRRRNDFAMVSPAISAKSMMTG